MIDLNMSVSTLHDFYSLMFATGRIRSTITEKILEGSDSPLERVNELKVAGKKLRAIPGAISKAVLTLEGETEVTIDLGYEISEIDKDLEFLSRDRDSFLSYLTELHPEMPDQIAPVLEKLQTIRFKNFITDRDGTVNNYCGRYLSSIQSIYNAVFLSHFGSRCVENAVILTSAPLENTGLVDISVCPEGVFYYAGSKGREYRNTSMELFSFPINPDQQAKIETLNKELEAILSQPAYRKFSLIGSGYQKKFGQTTIARQDINGSIDTRESEAFLGTLRELVDRVDDGCNCFIIEDTGLDVEIILTVESTDAGGAAKDFDKGDGVAFLNDDIGLQIETGPNLICGDTGSDVPMLEACVKANRDQTWAVFVTKQDALKQRVSSVTDKAFFVDEPDSLVTILEQLYARVS